MSHWRRVRYEGTDYRKIGIYKDGTLNNPNGYPEDVVRAAVAFADEEVHQRRSVAAKKAAQTRRERPRPARLRDGAAPQGRRSAQPRRQLRKRQTAGPSRANSHRLP
jgi:hypothetical protein